MGSRWSRLRLLGFEELPDRLEHDAVVDQKSKSTRIDSDLLLEGLDFDFWIDECWFDLDVVRGVRTNVTREPEVSLLLLACFQ